MSAIEEGDTEAFQARTGMQSAISAAMLQANAVSHSIILIA